MKNTRLCRHGREAEKKKCFTLFLLKMASGKEENESGIIELKKKDTRGERRNEEKEEREEKKKERKKERKKEGEKKNKER